jgi:quercetin dioxygenase-like cupin family protein
MSAEGKSFSSPDEIREFENGRFEVVGLKDATVGRVVLQPGWRWSENVKPIVGTDSCQQRHLGYVLSGSMHVTTDDGTDVDAGEGDVFLIEPGHDAWVNGDQEFVAVEFSSRTAETYAR